MDSFWRAVPKSHSSCFGIMAADSGGMDNNKRMETGLPSQQTLCDPINPALKAGSLDRPLNL